MGHRVPTEVVGFLKTLLSSPASTRSFVHEDMTYDLASGNRLIVVDPWAVDSPRARLSSIILLSIWTLPMSRLWSRNLHESFSFEGFRR